MAEPTILLEGRGIDKFFGKGRQRRQVLFGVDITVYAGECLAVIGGSGSGKTTLTRVLLGLEDADAGDIRYRGEVLRKQTVKSLRSQSGLVFQNPFDSLDPRWRVANPSWSRCGCATTTGPLNRFRRMWTTLSSG